MIVRKKSYFKIACLRLFLYTSKMKICVREYANEFLETIAFSSEIIN